MISSTIKSSGIVLFIVNMMYNKNRLEIGNQVIGWSFFKRNEKKITK